MGTSNFKKVNARHYYTIGEGWEEWDYDNLKAEIPAIMKEALSVDAPYEIRGCEPDPEWRTQEWNHQGYDGILLGSALIWQDFTVPYSKREVDGFAILVNVYMNCGYCEGATLDWDLGFRFYDCTGVRMFFLTEFDTQEEMFEEIADNFFDWLEYFYEEKKTPSKRKSLIKFLGNLFAKYADKADEICKANCQHVLGVTARFSNGETLYG